MNIWLLVFIPLVTCWSLTTLAQQSPKKKPITIALNDWASQIVLSYAVGDILKQIGHEVQFQLISTANQWQALATANINLQLEVWEGSMASDFNQMVTEDRIIDAGTHNVKTREEWWFPAYVLKSCPKLPNWAALNDCAYLFQTPISGKKGTYISGPWDKQEEKRISALKLNYIVKRVGGNAIKHHILHAVKTKKPILVFNWTPNWVETRIDGYFVSFPKYEAACMNQPSWGINPNEIMDCGNPSEGWLKKAVSKNMPNQWPCAYHFVRNIDFTNKMIAEAASLHEYDRLSYKMAAKNWLDAFKDKWQKWVPEYKPKA